jgi:hypothetical protein
MTQPSGTEITVGAPNWAPLEEAVSETEWADYMYMGRAGVRAFSQ